MFGFIEFINQLANEYYAAKKRKDELNKCASDPQYRSKLLSSRIDSIRRDVISRHSDDYWDPLFANYEDGAIELEQHLAAWDKSIARDIEDLKTLVDEGFVKPIDFLAKYQGDNFKDDATNLSALLGTATADRRDNGYHVASSVVDGHKKLVNFLFTDTEFKSACNDCESKKATLQPYFRPKVAL